MRSPKVSSVLCTGTHKRPKETHTGRPQPARARRRVQSGRTRHARHGLWPVPIITVRYGNRTPKKAGFSKEGVFWPSFGRILMGKASKSVPRPALGRPEADFEVFPIRIRLKLGPKVHSLLKPAFLGVRSP